MNVAERLIQINALENEINRLASQAENNEVPAEQIEEDSRGARENITRLQQEIGELDQQAQQFGGAGFEGF